MIDRDLIEGIDYCMEGELVVFTAQYLRDRGYCCTSGCRHCPFGFERNDPLEATACLKKDDESEL